MQLLYMMPKVSSYVRHGQKTRRNEILYIDITKDRNI